MASLQKYTSGRQTYWRIVESYRDQGKPKIRVLEYLGRADDVLSLVRGHREHFVTRSYGLGTVWALMDVAHELDVVNIINEHASKTQLDRESVRDGLSVGQSLLLAAIGRACHPTSKRGWRKFAQRTCLRPWLGPGIGRLDSQHFWDQMHRVPIEAIEKIEASIVQRMIEVEEIDPATILYDTTNFFTYIASTNTRCKLPERGKNKQKRYDLRQMGLALLVSQDGQLPLFHQLYYEGSRPDSVVFKQLLGQIRQRLASIWLALDSITLVYDKGNNSKKNQTAVDGLPCHYVAGLSASVLPDLTEEANGRFEPVVLPAGQQVSAYRIRRTVWGAERTLVVLVSETLREGQIRGLFQHINNRLKSLAQLAEELANPKGRKRDAKKLHDKIQRMLEGQHLAEVLTYRLLPRATGKFTLEFEVNQKAIEHLTNDVFGRRILMTDQHDWSTQSIILAYRGQSEVEKSFRCLKDPFHLALRPQYHWTDQKLHVHAFICVLAYLLTKIVHRRATQKTNYTHDLRQFMDDLARVRMCERIRRPQGKAGKPSLSYQLEQLDPDLEALAEYLNISPQMKSSWGSWYIR